jgi:hypothetical protein
MQNTVFHNTGNSSGSIIQDSFNNAISDSIQNDSQLMRHLQDINGFVPGQEGNGQGGNAGGNGGTLNGNEGNVNGNTAANGIGANLSSSNANPPQHHLHNISNISDDSINYHVALLDKLAERSISSSTGPANSTPKPLTEAK